MPRFDTFADQTAAALDVDEVSTARLWLVGNSEQL
jgi:hypothetical protein